MHEWKISFIIHIANENEELGQEDLLETDSLQRNFLSCTEKTGSEIVFDF